ncbi:heavy metal translocating P-type ATPase [Sulfurospirillum arcachonense]|uniref:heavy metal translocating P-type ATPase n=1 Tax=Sulfurospirillum arcachonense TaxID=57666 RepID=UPI000468EAEF|nr:heavy metal translocating P-type ATPase [Sulfurospirillum arcachonense]
MSKEKINLNISGMTCVNCSNGIERVVNKMEGLDNSKVNFTSNSGEFTIDTQLLDKNQLITKIKKLGYGVEEDIQALELAKKQSYIKLKNLFLISAFITTCMFVLMFFPIKDINPFIIFALASIVQFYPGGRFYSLAFKAISHKNYDMNVLVALGTSAAYFYSAFVVLLPDLFPEHLRFVYFDGASVIITFILLGRLLEERSKGKATDFLKNLMDLAPLNANLIDENAEIKSVLAKDLHVNDIVLIKQGEKVSTDAVIIEGKAEIDTSMITGEPMPVYKTIGDEVIAGTINKTGTLKVKVLKQSHDTTLSKIISLLNDAGSKKLPIARFADKVANIFVPTVIAISIITFFAWFFIVGDTLSAILASISVLIISCPCALGLATPIAIVSSVGKGAREGILIKNPEILEIIKDIKYAVFDKTGTLTKGEISVKDMFIDEQYLSIIASTELQSEHPISQAIVKYAKQKEIKLDKNIQDLQILAGLGVSADYENQKILVGNLTLLEKNNISISPQILESFEGILKQGYGAVLASIDSVCVGVISLEDSLKEGAEQLITDLKKKNIVPILLTGDNETTAKTLASKIGIELVYAEVLPDEKYKVIKDLQNDSKVMFVGDGINDSVSIKQADIGVALNSGSDITKDAGDIILMNNELNSVMKSINLSVKTMKTIKQNLFWAFFYNTLGIPLAAGVLYPIIGVMLSPMYAGIAMSFSSVSVVLNSLRLKFAKL